MYRELRTLYGLSHGVYYAPMKKLTRSTTNKVFAGVMGGFGEYFEVDATLLRVIFIFFVLVTGLFPGVFAYLIAILIMPLAGAPTVHTVHDETKR